MTRFCLNSKYFLSKNLKLNLNIVLWIYFFNFLFNEAVAQTNTFSRVYFNNISTQSTDILETPDKGFLISGENESEGLLMKTDSAGQIIFTKQMGNTTNEKYNCLLPVNDSIFLASGKILSGSSLDAIITKFNSIGDTVWSRKIDLGYSEEAVSMDICTDGGYIIAASISLGSAPNNNIGVIKLDSSGQLQWSKKFSCGTNGDIPYCIKSDSSGEYYLSGMTENFPPFDAEGFLIKLNSSGNIIWSKKYHIPNTWTMLKDFKIKGSSIYGLLATGGPQLGLIKTDMNGNVINNQIFLGINPSQIINEKQTRINLTQDNGFIVSNKEIMIKTDSLLQQEWTYSPMLYLCNVFQCHDKGYMLCGNGPILGVMQPQSLVPQIGIIKTDSSGFGPQCFYGSSSISVMQDTISITNISFTETSLGTVSVAHPTFANVTIQSNSSCVDFYGSTSTQMSDTPENLPYPNPADGFCTLAVNGIKWEGTEKISVFNFMGEESSVQVTHTSDRIKINVSELPDGPYLMVVSSLQRHRTYKFNVRH